MTPEQKQLIREKFNNEWQFKWEAGDDTREGETNWWLNEIDLAIKQTEERIVRDERMKISMLYRNWKRRPEADSMDFDDIISKL